MATRPLFATIREHRSCPAHNACILQFDVYAGDDPRDYVFADYRPQMRVGSFKTRAEAEAFIGKLMRGEVDWHSTLLINRGEG